MAVPCSQVGKTSETLLVTLIIPVIQKKEKKARSQRSSLQVGGTDGRRARVRPGRVYLCDPCAKLSTSIIGSVAIPLETKKLWAVFVIPPYEMWAAAPENKSFL